QAKQAEAEKAVQAAELTVQTHTRLDEKDEEVLASLKAQLPGLLALQRNAQFYYERFKSLANTGDVPIQDFDNRDAAYRDAIARREPLQRNIKAAESEVLASHLKVQEARVRLEQSRKTLNNAVAEVGRATAAQLQPKVATNTAVALHNKKALAEARLRLAK